MLPLDGFVRVVIHFIVVVLPAPFGPRNPNTSFGQTSKETPSKAFNRQF
jgi:hypothetical protein